jgi:hypothetical protein
MFKIINKETKSEIDIDLLDERMCFDYDFPELEFAISQSGYIFIINEWGTTVQLQDQEQYEIVLSPYNK